MHSQNVCTPAAILELAEYFGVRVSSDGAEFHLLPIVKAAAEVPVPDTWEERFDDDGQRYYVHKKSFVCSTKHPLDHKFFDLVLTNRRRGAHKEDADKTWMRLTDRQGNVMFHNFADGTSTAACPDPRKLLDPLSEDEIPQDTVATSYNSKVSICKPPDLENIRFLCFKSWWNEDLESTDLTFRDNGWQAGGGLKKRYICLKFDLAQKNFHVRIDSTDQCVKISNMKHVTAKNGSPLQCWDLHVGAKLDILGKTVTLMQASLETSLWIDNHKKKMTRLKAELEELVKKYQYRPFVNAITITKSSKFPGGASLRSLIDQISHIIQVLADFRPALGKGTSGGSFGFTSSFVLGFVSIFVVAFVDHHN